MTDKLTKYTCSHCGEAVPEKMARGVEPGQPMFCCTGCAALYSALHESGLDGFYAYSSLTLGDGVASKPQVRVGAAEQAREQDAFLSGLARREGGQCALDLHIDGLHCAGCVWLIEQLPRHVEGVKDAQLDVGRARLEVVWDEEATRPSEIIAWLSRFGYGAHPLDASRVGQRDEAEAQLLRRMGVAWAVAGNIMLLAFADYAGLDASREPTLAAAARWTSFLVSIISMVYGADLFLRRAWASLVSFVRDDASVRAPLSMDVPLALGIVVGWGASAWATVRSGGEVWFDSVAMLTAGLLTARWVQLRASRLARHAAERLLSLLPRTARVVRDDGRIEEIDARELAAGDVVEVRLGETIPADGVIVSGEGHVDRAVLTGESAPERARVGAAVEAGSVNRGAVIRARVERAGEQTRVGALLGWIEDRARRRAPIVQLADRFGVWFVGAVLGVAALTAVAWAFVDPAQISQRIVAILVISCPCALSMATPLALAVSVGRASRRAIFIKHDDVIEPLAHASVVVLDKTGTLTTGQMSLVDWWGDPRALTMARAVEAGSAHPLARAIAGWAPDEGVVADAALTPPEAVEEIAGCGVAAEIDGHAVRVGRIAWVADETPAHVERLARAWAEAGTTPVGVSVDGALVAALGVGDALREDAPGLIRALTRRGVRPVILSGDDPRVVAAMAARLDVADARGGCTPEDKLAAVEALKAEVKGAGTVVMVGDGVNDAAAMQAADVGVAVHGGAQVSLVAADIFLTRHGVLAVLELIEGARRTLGVIRRNLISSVVYNVFAIALAAMGWVSPLVAALLMPLSSLSVVFASWMSPTFDVALRERLERDVQEEMNTTRPAGDTMDTQPPLAGAHSAHGAS